MIGGRACDTLYFLKLFALFPVKEVGVYSWAVAVTALFSVVFDLGLTQILIREFSKSTLRLRTALMTSVIIRGPIVLAGILALIGWMLLYKPSHLTLSLLMFFGVIQVLTIVENICFSWLKAKKHQTVANCLSTTLSVARLTSIYIVICVSVGYDILYMVRCTLYIHIALIAVCIALCGFLDKEARAAGHESLRLTVKYFLGCSIAFGMLGAITAMQNRIDWVLVSMFAGNSELAQYSMANRFYELVVATFGVAVTTSYPWLCKPDLSREEKSKIDALYLLLLVTGVLVSLSLTIILPFLLKFYYQEKYAAAEPIIQLLLPVTAFTIPVMILFYRIVAGNAEKWALLISVVATLFQVAVDFEFIPRAGGKGAAYGMAALIMVSLISYSLLALRRGLVTRSKLFRQLGFLSGMLGFHAIMSILHTPASLHLCALVIIVPICGYSILPEAAERELLNSRVKIIIARQGSVVAK